MRRFIKFLHTVSGAGLTGGLAAYMMVLVNAPDITALSEYAALRTALAVVSKWLLLPAMVIAVTSGLMALVVHHPFQNAGWVWLKALSGLLLFEATLASIDGPAQRAAKAASASLDGELSPAQLANLVHNEWTAWWILLAICVANVALAIWRPRLVRSPS